jgi:hypothetical protein
VTVARLSDILIWVVAGMVAAVTTGLVLALPFSLIPRRPNRPEERVDCAVREAQNEAELLYRRQPPVG